MVRFGQADRVGPGAGRDRLSPRRSRPAQTTKGHARPGCPSLSFRHPPFAAALGVPIHARPAVRIVLFLDRDREIHVLAVAAATLVVVPDWETPCSHPSIARGTGRIRRRMSPRRWPVAYSQKARSENSRSIASRCDAGRARLARPNRELCRRSLRVVRHARCDRWPGAAPRPRSGAPRCRRPRDRCGGVGILEQVYWGASDPVKPRIGEPVAIIIQAVHRDARVDAPR